MALQSHPFQQSLLVSACLVGVVLSACERPPVGGTDTPLPDDVAELDLPRFLQDRPAIGGKWYEYSVDGHVLEAKDEAWVIRTPRGDVAMRIASIYDDDTGDSGRFHLQLAPREANGWGDDLVVVAPQNVKDAPAVCIDVVAAANGDDDIQRDCTTGSWDLRLLLQSRLSVFAGFAVAEPAIYAHNDVRMARFDGVELAALPDPNGIAVLDDTPSFETTDWSFNTLAPDLPPAGLVMGAVDRVVDSGETWWLYAHATLVAFTASQPAPGVFRLHHNRRDVDSGTFGVAIAAPASVDFDVVTQSLPVFVSFAGDTHLVDPSTIAADGAGDVRPGNTRIWDLAIVDVDGTPVVYVSPAAAALNGRILNGEPPFSP